MLDNHATLASMAHASNRTGLDEPGAADILPLATPYHDERGSLDEGAKRWYPIAVVSTLALASPELQVMAEDDPRKSWWHTLPGIITGITATITALGGLVVAINQTNWFSRSVPDATSPQSEVATATGPIAPDTPPELPTATDTPPDAAVSDTPSGDAAMVTLPKMRSYTLGEVEFTLLDASLAPRNSESSTLAIRVRLLNNRNYPVNFWDSQFRLLVDGIPRAPNSGLNVVVEGNAADEGEITFIVPKSATDPQLRILFADEKTDIPLPLAHGD